MVSLKKKNGFLFSICKNVRKDMKLPKVTMISKRVPHPRQKNPADLAEGEAGKNKNEKKIK